MLIFPRRGESRYPHFPYSRGDAYEEWDKVGEAVENLEELQEIVVCRCHHPGEGERAPRHDWLALACILECLRHNIKFHLSNIHSCTEFEVRAFCCSDSPQSFYQED
jgi:hypothetical protein